MECKLLFPGLDALSSARSLRTPGTDLGSQRRVVWRHVRRPWPRLPSFTTNFRALSFQVIRKSTTDRLHLGGVLPSEQRLRTFLLGRLALRQALPSVAELSLTSPISKDEHGRPQVPPGFVGSITHKDKTGVALVAPQEEEDSIMSIGVDIEKS